MTQQWNLQYVPIIRQIQRINNLLSDQWRASSKNELKLGQTKWLWIGNIGRTHSHLYSQEDRIRRILSMNLPQYERNPWKKSYISWAGFLRKNRQDCITILGRILGSNKIQRSIQRNFGQDLTKYYAELLYNSRLWSFTKVWKKNRIAHALKFSNLLTILFWKLSRDSKNVWQTCLGYLLKRLSRSSILFFLMKLLIHES